jgi:hypothetical protein
MHELPAQAQFAPVYGMQADDLNADGNLDLLLCGNDFGTEVAQGRYDALNGLLLLGDGKGNFTPQSAGRSGICIPGDAKALVKLTGPDNRYLVAASQNRGDLKMFRLRQSAGRVIRLRPDDIAAYITLKSGKTRKVEIGYGTSFLSQSSRTLLLNPVPEKLVIVNNAGQQRRVSPGDK